MERLKDKVAVVTGAASGVGRCISHLFTAEGAKVVMIDRAEENLKKTAEEVRAAGGDILEFKGDVSVLEDVKEAFKATIDKYGKVDIVVNNAGIVNYNEGVAGASDKDCAELWETNALGELYCMREAMQYMLPAGQGTFVAIGSVGGCRGHGGAAYALSKGAQVNLARQVAFEYHKEGIRSNVICPDGINTPLIKDENGWKAVDPHVAEACTSHVCPGTPICQPEEVAQVALFLASDESRAVNGQVIIVDHGANL